MKKRLIMLLIGMLVLVSGCTSNNIIIREQAYTIKEYHNPDACSHMNDVNENYAVLGIEIQTYDSETKQIIEGSTKFLSFHEQGTGSDTKGLSCYISPSSSNIYVSANAEGYASIEKLEINKTFEQNNFIIMVPMEKQS